MQILAKLGERTRSQMTNMIDSYFATAVRDVAKKFQCVNSAAPTDPPPHQTAEAVEGTLKKFCAVLASVLADASPEEVNNYVLYNIVTVIVFSFVTMQ